jgi:hypothetical protein
MVNVSLKELIRFGDFGPVRLGMNREQVESILGAPDGVSVGSRKYAQATILKYGDVEFHFDPRDGRLWLIHLEQFEAPSAGKSVRLDPWVIRASLTVSEMEEILSRDGIAHQVSDQADWDDYKCLVAGAGVKLIFSGGQFRLSALSRCDVRDN